MYVNSDDVIKCFSAYLCHKSRAPNFGPRTSGPELRAPNRVPPRQLCSKDMCKTTYVSFDVLTLISDAFEHITQA